MFAQPRAPRVADGAHRFDRRHGGGLVGDACAVPLFAGDAHLLVVQARFEQLERVAFGGAETARHVGVDVLARGMRHPPLAGQLHVVDLVAVGGRRRKHGRVHVERVDHEREDVAWRNPGRAQGHDDRVGVQRQGPHLVEPVGQPAQALGARARVVEHGRMPSIPVAHEPGAFAPPCVQAFGVQRCAHGLFLRVVDGARPFGGRSDVGEQVFADCRVLDECVHDRRGVRVLGHDPSDRRTQCAVDQSSTVSPIAVAFEQGGHGGAPAARIEAVGPYDTVEVHGSVVHGHPAGEHAGRVFVLRDDPPPHWIGAVPPMQGGHGSDMAAGHAGAGQPQVGRVGLVEHAAGDRRGKGVIVVQVQRPVLAACDRPSRVLVCVRARGLDQ